MKIFATFVAMSHCLFVCPCCLVELLFRAQIRGPMANFVGSTTEVNPDVDSSPFLPHQEECEEEHHDGTMFGTTINTLTAIIGGGILAIPLALANASIIPGVVLMLLCGSAAVLTSYFLICVCEHTQRFTYKDLMNAAFPNHVRWAGKLAEAVMVHDELLQSHCVRAGDWEFDPHSIRRCPWWN